MVTNTNAGRRIPPPNKLGGTLRRRFVGVGTVRKTRFVLRDGSYIDVQFSASGRYSYHWERRHIDGKLYRFDNAPHHPEVATFPHHLHDGSEEKVVESQISVRPEEAVPQILDFARAKLRG